MFDAFIIEIFNAKRIYDDIGRLVAGCFSEVSFYAPYTFAFGGFDLEDSVINVAVGSAYYFAAGNETDVISCMS